MKLNRVASASLAVGATLALMAASAGVASAAPAGHHPKHHSKPKPKGPVTQVTGSTLAKGLLPASAFGSGYTMKSGSSGSSLWPTTAVRTLAGASCKDFQETLLIGYGDTAAAGANVLAPNSSNPPSSAPLIAFEEVAQFASKSSASTFFQQLQAKYNHCPSISFTLNDTTLGQLTETITNQNIASTTVGGYSAFQVDQADQLSDQTGDGTAASVNTTAVVAGTNVYEVQWLTISDVKIPNWIMSNLMKNTQALYKH